MRRRGLHTRHWLAAIAVAILSASAQAQTFPSRPVTIIVPFPAGGPTDTLARILSEPMRAGLGQPVIVENVSGATGSLGIGRLARSAPDGLTLALGNWTSSVGAPAIYPVAYDILADFEPVALATTSRLVIIARKSLPADDVRALIAWLKANPGKATAGTIGVGSPSHVGGLHFRPSPARSFIHPVSRRRAGAAGPGRRPDRSPFRGGSVADPAHLRDGTIKVLAIMGDTRWPAAPDIPTVDEAGVPGLYLSFWQAFWLPKGTPKEIVARLNAVIVDALNEPAVRQRLTDLGQDLPPRAQQTPEALAAFHKAEIDKWWPIIRQAGIKGE